MSNTRISDKEAHRKTSGTTALCSLLHYVASLIIYIVSGGVEECIPII